MASKIVQLINEPYKKFKVPIGILQNIPTKDRAAVGFLLKLDKFVDVIIPRGGRSLIERVIDESFILNKNPIKSVAKPGMINNIAAKARAAPDTISFTGNSFFINWLMPDLSVLNPSYLA